MDSVARIPTRFCGHAEHVLTTKMSRYLNTALCISLYLYFPFSVNDSFDSSPTQFYQTYPPIPALPSPCFLLLHTLLLDIAPPLSPLRLNPPTSNVIQNHHMSNFPLSCTRNTISILRSPFPLRIPVNGSRWVSLWPVRHGQVPFIGNDSTTGGSEAAGARGMDTFRYRKKEVIWDIFSALGIQQAATVGLLVTIAHRRNGELKEGEPLKSSMSKSRQKKRDTGEAY